MSSLFFKGGNMHFLKRVRCHWVAMFIFCCGFAQAGETVKIGFIDVLSGPFALTGQGSLKQLKEVVFQLNAKSGADDPKFEVVEFDNKGSTQESINMLKAASDKALREFSEASIGEDIFASLTLPFISEAVIEHKLRRMYITLKNISDIGPTGNCGGCNARTLSSPS